MKFKKLTAMLLSIVMCFFSLGFLTSCSSENTISTEPVFQENDTEQTEYVDLDSSGDSVHINATLSSGVIVDADVFVPDSVDLNALTECEVRMRVQDFDLLAELLLADKIITDSASGNSDGSLTGTPFRSCETEDGFSLVSSGQDIYFDGSLYSRVGSLLDRSEFGNSTVFLSDQNLDFSTIEDAESAVNLFLMQLGIDANSKPLCYTMDYNNMVNECEKYISMQEETFGEVHHPISIEESDECYIFLYQINLQNRPISTHANGAFGDGSWTSGTSVLCAYSAEGIVALQIDYQFEAAGKDTQPEQGMTVEQALERLDQKYNSMLPNGNILVECIEFEYVPMPIQGELNRYTLLPAWRLSLVHTYDEVGKENTTGLVAVDRRSSVVFHAITGAEMINDSGNA